METIIKKSLLLVCILLAGCSTDNLIDNKENDKIDPEKKGLTTFVSSGEAQESKEQKQIRTVGQYEKDNFVSQLNVSWMKGDHIWVKRENGWAQDSANSIKGDYELFYRNEQAHFYFPGVFTAPSYVVRYTGHGNATTHDKVTIASVQNQEYENQATQFGLVGDCAVGIANKITQQGGFYYYFFKLDHKAAYITFAPYSEMKALWDISNTYIRQIKVTADKAISGTFNFTDDGIDLNSRPATTDENKTITFNVGKGTKGFGVNPSTTKGRGYAMMVIAPGTYETFKVEYTLEDGYHNKLTFSNEYKNVTFKAGKNKFIRQHMQVSNLDAMGVSVPQRWSRHDAEYCPNVNEIVWYIEKGDPHFVDKEFYQYNDRLYYGAGVWIKKQSVIATENHKIVADLKAKAPDEKDYTRGGYPTSNITGLPTGRPEKIEDYFFLRIGDYWSSTEVYNSSGNIFYLSTQENNKSIRISQSGKDYSRNVWRAQ